MIHKHKGSGRAMCRICEKKIEKKEIAIQFTYYQGSKQYHLSCLNKMNLGEYRL